MKSKDTKFMDQHLFIINGLEITPNVWESCEALTHPDLQVRREGIQRLVETRIARNSPLVAFILATKLTDPDLSFRTYIVKVLADVFDYDTQGQLPSEVVRVTLINYLAQMRTRQVFSLLQVVDYDPSSTVQVAKLMGNCSFAGKHLLDILTNRNAPISIRQSAVRLIGLIGYSDTVQELDRFLLRVESRINPQSESVDESSLIPLIKETLNLIS